MKGYRIEYILPDIPKVFVVYKGATDEIEAKTKILGVYPQATIRNIHLENESWEVLMKDLSGE